VPVRLKLGVPSGAEQPVEGVGDGLAPAFGFEHAPDLLVNSFYDPVLEEGCAFEELISFHGGLGGPQTRPFILHPAHLPVPSEPIVGAAAVHALLTGWRGALQSEAAGPEAVPEPARLA